MALRNPVYLDLEALLAHADYHDIRVPVQEDIVEKTIRQRSGKARAGYGPIGGEGARSTGVELQSSYTMTPTQRATVSKVIDALILEDVVSGISGDPRLSRDELVEIEGDLRVTTASLAGKMFYLIKQYLTQTDQAFDNVDFQDAPNELMQLFQRTYLENELVPIPLLLDLRRSKVDAKVFVNLRPDFFVEHASVDRAEGAHRVLGTVRLLVPGGTDGYLSAEEWLLDGWEYLIKRMMMTDISDQVRELAEGLDLDLPSDDVQAWIQGPAVLIDAVAVY